MVLISIDGYLCSVCVKLLCLILFCKMALTVGKCK